jgi:uncharacterized membrane-anchored protein
MLGAIALVASGAAIVVVGVYFWSRPEQYYRYLHRASLLADLSVRPPTWAVKLGAGLSVLIGLAVAGWGVIELAA